MPFAGSLMSCRYASNILRRKKKKHLACNATGLAECVIHSAEQLQLLDVCHKTSKVLPCDLSDEAPNKLEFGMLMLKCV